jgi:zinc protease
MKKVAKGPILIFMPEKGAPLVHLDFALMHGSLRDPEGKDGVASFTMSMLLRGTKKKTAQEFHRALDNLGAEIHLGKYKESMRLYGTVLSDKLPDFLDLIEDLLTEPAFREDEFEKIRAQVKSALLDELGSDDEIADRRFQEYLLWGNPYGRITIGSLESLERISTEDLRAFHREFFRADDFVVGASGGFDRKYLGKRVKEILGRLQRGSAGRLSAPAPVIRREKVLLLLEKPSRTQAQITIGAPGVSFADKDYFAMMAANHVFGGGSFSARLMKEVREKRGWAYGAYSFYRSGRKPLYFAMHTVPSNKDAIPALELMIELYRDFAKNGITKAEFEFAKKSLVNQSAFLQDTVRKRLDNKVTEAVLGLPEGFYDQYRQKLSRLTLAKVQSAIRRHADPSRLFALVLGTASELEADMVKLKGFAKVWKRSFDQPPTDLRALDPYSVPVRRSARKGVSRRR